VLQSALAIELRGEGAVGMYPEVHQGPECQFGEVGLGENSADRQEMRPRPLQHIPDMEVSADRHVHLNESEGPRDRQVIVKPGCGKGLPTGWAKRGPPLTSLMGGDVPTLSSACPRLGRETDFGDHPGILPSIAQGTILNARDRSPEDRRAQLVRVTEDFDRTSDLTH